MSGCEIFALVMMSSLVIFLFFELVCQFVSELSKTRMKKKQKEIEEKERCIAEIYSSYANLQINNYILKKNEDKYLKEIERLKKRIKKINAYIEEHFLKANSVK